MWVCAHDVERKVQSLQRKTPDSPQSKKAWEPQPDENEADHVFLLQGHQYAPTGTQTFQTITIVRTASFGKIRFGCASRIFLNVLDSVNFFSLFCQVLIGYKILSLIIHKNDCRKSQNTFQFAAFKIHRCIRKGNTRLKYFLLHKHLHHCLLYTSRCV